LGSKESLFGVYFGSGLVPINEYRFGPYGIQSWLGLIKMLGIRSDLFTVDFLILQGLKLAKYSPNTQENFVYYFPYYFR
jgi:hypothetical protein